MIFGFGRREKADQDGLIISVCNDCHTYGKMSIHGNTAAEKLSKMLGQALWERDQVLKGCSGIDQDYANYLNEEVRNRFIERYGRNWLE